MSMKRQATTQLTKDSWEKEEGDDRFAPIEVAHEASAEVLAKRKMIRGVRTLGSKSSESSEAATLSAEPTAESAPEWDSTQWEDIDISSFDNASFPSFDKVDAFAETAKTEKPAGAAAPEKEQIEAALKIARTLSAAGRKELITLIGEITDSKPTEVFPTSDLAWDSVGTSWGDNEATSWGDASSSSWGDNFADSFGSEKAGDQPEEGQPEEPEEEPEKTAEPGAGEEGETKLFEGTVDLSQYTIDPDAAELASSSSAESANSAPAEQKKRWIQRGPVQLRVLRKELEPGVVAHRIVARTQATNNLLMNIRLSPLMRVLPVDEAKFRIITKEGDETTQYLIKIRHGVQGNLFQTLSDLLKTAK
jgi:hypothetical protein